MSAMPQNQVPRGLVLIALFSLALFLRLNGLFQPPVEYHPTRQYRSAILAHGLYVRTQPDIAEWQRAVAEANLRGEGFIEPPIMEHLAVIGYRLLGAEQLWFPRLASALFWLTGGVFLYLLAVRLGTPDEGLVATGLYLYLPMTIKLSRVFQPEPLMMMLLLISLWLLVRYDEQPDSKRLVTTAVVSATALLVKPVAVFPILFVFAALYFSRHSWRELLLHREWLTFGLICFAPIAAYYGVKSLTTRLVSTQVRLQFIQSLWFDRNYWSGWYNMIIRAVGLLGVPLSVIGLFLLERRRQRTIMLALWLSYLVFGLVFTYAIYTHDYYQSMLFPVVALSIAPIGSLILGQVGTKLSTQTIRALFLVVLIALVAATSLSWNRRQTVTYESVPLSVVDLARTIGESVDHSTHTLLLTQPHVDNILRYHGEIAGSTLLSPGVVTALELQGRHVDPHDAALSLIAQDTFDFLIVTDFSEFQRQSLQDIVLNNYPIYDEGEGYIIFDLRDR